MEEIQYTKPRTDIIDERNPNGAGRPTDLTQEVLRKIKESILSGNNLKETANFCGINVDTLYNWTTENYQNLSDKIEGWKRDRKVKIAEEFGERLMLMEEGDKDILRLKQKESEFVRETLGKTVYSKRSEMTGKDGESLSFGLVGLLDSANGKGEGDKQ